MARQLLRLLLALGLCAWGWATPATSTLDVATPDSSILGKVAAPSTEGETLLEGLRIIYPVENAKCKSPLQFRFYLLTPDIGRLFAEGDYWVCLNLDGVWARCFAIDRVAHVVEELELGNHTARAMLSDSPKAEGARSLFLSEEVRFEVLGNEAFEASLRQQRLDELALYEGTSSKSNADVGLLEWFEEQKQHQETQQTDTRDQHGPEAQTVVELAAATGEIDSPEQRVGQAHTDQDPNTATQPPLLVIGVKTRVVEGFPFRQAIRETWASSENLPRDVRVLFVGCRVAPDATSDIQRAVAHEQLVYADLLTDTLDCEDSYAALALKVKEFLYFTGTHPVYRHAGYVLLTDEDAYIRTDMLAATLREAPEPMHHLYAGHVMRPPLFPPMRDPQHRTYISKEEYPMNEFPPFAWGQHFLLSMDVVQFIATNRDELQVLRGLDDVSVALWLLAIQVHPQHLEAFDALRTMACWEGVVAYADLAPSAMRIIASNLRAGRSFCHGFNAHTWDKATLTVH